MADETSEATIQCIDHPYRKNPGGICAFCLQEKLGKLVSSSKLSSPFLSIPPLPSSPSSSPPPSDFPSRIPFLSSKTHRRKPNAESLVLNRSKSVIAANSPRKKRFWSFLTQSHSSSSAPIPPSFITKRRSEQVPKDDEASEASPSGSQASSSFGRKVARSRSVGCGSRSFSGDFLERISNGFGDCALRRVESHRESKQKSSVHQIDGEDEQRVKCGGMFVGLGMTSYWLSAAESVRLPPARRGGRSRSWGWAFASPMRAFRPGGGGGQTTVISAGEQ